MKDLYTESYKMLLREIRNLNKWKEAPRSWIGKLNIFTTTLLLKMTYRFNAIPIKIFANLTTSRGVIFIVGLISISWFCTTDVFLWIDWPHLFLFLWTTCSHPLRIFYLSVFLLVCMDIVSVEEVSLVSCVVNCFLVCCLHFDCT